MTFTVLRSNQSQSLTAGEGRHSVRQRKTLPTVSRCFHTWNVNWCPCQLDMMLSDPGVLQPLPSHPLLHDILPIQTSPNWPLPSFLIRWRDSLGISHISLVFTDKSASLGMPRLQLPIKRQHSPAALSERGREKKEWQRGGVKKKTQSKGGDKEGSRKVGYMNYATDKQRTQTQGPLSKSDTENAIRSRRFIVLHLRRLRKTTDHRTDTDTEKESSTLEPRLDRLVMRMTSRKEKQASYCCYISTSH